jgi:hypothetical protein
VVHPLITGNNALKRRGQALKPADIGQGLVRAAAAQLRVSPEIQADAGALRPAEQGTEVVRSQMHAAYARGLSAGHARDGAGDGDGNAAGSAARAAVHGSKYNRNN